MGCGDPPPPTGSPHALSTIPSLLTLIHTALVRLIRVWETLRKGRVEGRRDEEPRLSAELDRTNTSGGRMAVGDEGGERDREVEEGPAEVMGLGGEVDHRLPGPQLLQIERGGTHLRVGC